MKLKSFFLRSWTNYLHAMGVLITTSTIILSAQTDIALQLSLLTRVVDKE